MICPPFSVDHIQNSPLSGRLQLVDATGSIDVLVPDLPSTWDANRILKVILDDNVTTHSLLYIIVVVE